MHLFYKLNLTLPTDAIEIEGEIPEPITPEAEELSDEALESRLKKLNQESTPLLQHNLMRAPVALKKDKPAAIERKLVIN